MEEGLNEESVKKGTGKSKFLSFTLLAIFAFAFSLLFYFIPFSTTGHFVKSGTGPYTYTCSNCSDCTDALADAGSGDIVYLNQSISVSGNNNCTNMTNKNNIIFDCQNNVISGSLYSTGIFLLSSNNSQIRNCNILGFYTGISLSYSNNNILTNINTSNNNNMGIDFSYSNNNILTNIKSYDNSLGVRLDNSNNNTLTNINTSRNVYGLFFIYSYTNFIYNNFFNNTNNCRITSNVPTPFYFNTTKTLATNIIGGSYIGGNFWATPTGTGFSQNCTADTNNDKICDTPYILSSDNYEYYDYLPLIYNITNMTCTESWTCSNYGSCNASGIKIRNCTDANSCGTNITKPALNSTCTYSCTENWNCTAWSSCNASGVKIKNCTDINHCGTNTTRPALNSTCTYSANCTESWTCSDWSECSPSGIKTKTCTDTHNCGTTVNKPALTSTCTYSNATGETGASPTEGVGTNVTQNVTTVTPTTPAVIHIDDSQIYLTKITLNVLESIQSASVTVTKVNVLSDANLAMGLPSGQFYQGFRVDTAGVNDSNIANVTIEFKVNKLWLASRNGTVNGMGLYRKPDTSSEWNSLITLLTSEDSAYYYFTSISPGFSTFAVLFQTCEGSECAGTAGSLGTWLKDNNLTAWFYVVVSVVGVAIIIVFYVLLKKVKGNTARVVKKEVPKKPVKSSSYSASKY